MSKFSDSLWRISGVLSISELETLAPMGERFFAERKNLPGTFNKERWIETWDRLLRINNIAMFQLLDPKGKQQGAIAGIVTNDLNTGDLIAVEQFWYVERTARGHGLSLLKHFERWALGCGATRVTLGHVWDGAKQAVWERFYAMKGYKPLEIHYYKVLP
jgi:GNAT superfamily N-acetyltransferase